MSEENNTNMANKVIAKAKGDVGAKANLAIKTTVPDGGWGWIVCISCLFGNLAAAGPVTSYGIILPSLKEYYNEGAFIISLVGSIFNALGYAIGPIVGKLITKFGLRVVYILGSLFYGLSLLAATLSPDAYVLLITYGVLAGIGLCLLGLPVTIGCNYYFEKRRALANGIAKTGVSIGVFMYPPMTHFILERYDWKTVVYVYAGILFLSCFFGALIKPLELVEIKSSNNPEENETNNDNNDQHRKTKRSISVDFTNIDEVHVNSCFNLNENETSKSKAPRRASLSQFQEKHTINEKSRRRSSFVQIQKVVESNNEDNTEFIFKPEQRRGSKVYLQPLAKHDSFYDCSLSTLYKNEQEVSSISQLPPFIKSSMNQTYSVISLKAPNKSSVENEKGRSTILDKFDSSLWCDPSLLLLLVSRLSANFSKPLFFMFLPILLIDHGFSLKQASLILMIYGITNTVARVIVGASMDHPRVNNFILTAAGLFLQAILILIFPFCDQFNILMVCSGIIGIAVAPFEIGMAVLVGEMLPIEKVASACGILYFAQGIGSIIGPPLAGFIYDNSKYHTVIFFLIAIGYIISGVTCWLSGYMHTKRTRNNSTA